MTIVAVISVVYSAHWGPMSQLLTAIVFICSLLAAIWTIYALASRGRKTASLVTLLALLAYVGALHFFLGFPSSPNVVAKGAESEPSQAPLVLALFLLMVLGMLADYLYSYLDAPKGRVHFEWRSFLKPIVVSPLVFVPLAGSLQNENVDLSHFTIPVLMLFLVAFENGFLWRGYFERKVKDSRTAPEEHLPEAIK
jgi:predicted permease